jgi:hypothetical protein
VAKAPRAAQDEQRRLQAAHPNDEAAVRAGVETWALDVQSTTGGR